MHAVQIKDHRCTPNCKFKSVGAHLDFDASKVHSWIYLRFHDRVQLIRYTHILCTIAKNASAYTWDGSAPL